jgi:hypothetical protein
MRDMDEDSWRDLNDSDEQAKETEESSSSSDSGTSFIQVRSDGGYEADEDWTRDSLDLNDSDEKANETHDSSSSDDSDKNSSFVQHKFHSSTVVADVERQIEQAQAAKQYAKLSQLYAQLDSLTKKDVAQPAVPTQVVATAQEKTASIWTTKDDSKSSDWYKSDDEWFRDMDEDSWRD